MTGEDNEVIALYVESKFSETQIAEHLSIGPERVRRILKKNKVPKRTISDAIRYWYITEYKKKQFILNPALNARQEMLKLAAVMLYWGEGTKGGKSLTLHNSDPSMIALYVRFLKEVCGVDAKRLRVTLHMYPDQQATLLKKFWSNMTGIPVTQFHKPFVHRNTKGSYKKKSQYGTVAVVYSDVELLKLMNRWIDEYKKVFIKPA